ncbi:MAG: hypothetical protein GY943_36920, partial [Chloroflexi bacterium]|nr:hypothetical protein [Chloroflexota bacterium]
MAQKKKSTSTRKKSTTKRTNAKSRATRGGTAKKRPSTRKPASKRSTTRKKPASKRSSTRSKKRSSRDITLNLQQKSLIGGIAIVFTAALLVLSLISPTQGQFTSAMSNLLWRGFGWGGYLIPIITGAGGLYLVFWGMDQPLELPAFRLIGATLLFITAESFASLIMVMRNNGLNDVWSVAKAAPSQAGGGYFGGVFVYVFREAVGNVGSIFTLMVVGMIGLIMEWGLTREDMSYYLHATLDWFKNRPERDPAPRRDIAINTGRSRRSSSATAEPIQPPLIPDAADVAAAKSTAKRKAKSKPEVEPKRPSSRKRKPDPTPPAAEPTIASPVFLGNNGRPQGHQWQIPTVAEMLEPGMDQDNSGTIIREQVEVIEHTLDSFGAPATVVEINQGPT